MVVYAVMRGVQLIKLYSTRDVAQSHADHFNSMFKRGKRATVVTVPVADEF